MCGFSPDPYEILGIARDATQREVKQAYRRLAKKFHPDHNPGKPEAEERFKQIQRAYEILTGRKRPDRSSPAAFHGRRYPPSFFRNEHPFYSFFWNMMTHSDQMMKNMKPSFQQGDDKKNDVKK